MKDIKKLKELIIEKVDLSEVMQDYNVDFVYNPSRIHEVQFRCPFHGKDNKPSARLYKETKSIFCWVCHKTWDVITFIRDKENISYKAAMGFIIRKYKVDTSSIPDGPSIDLTKHHSSISEIDKLMPAIADRINELKFKTPLDKYKILWSVYDKILYRSSKGEDMLSNANKLKNKVHTLMGINNNG